MTKYSKAVFRLAFDYYFSDQYGETTESELIEQDWKKFTLISYRKKIGKTEEISKTVTIWFKTLEYAQTYVAEYNEIGRNYSKTRHTNIEYFRYELKDF